MPGDSGGPRGDYARVVLFFPTRGCGCNGHPAFPTPSFLSGKPSCIARAKSRREIAEVWVGYGARILRDAAKTPLLRMRSVAGTWHALMVRSAATSRVSNHVPDCASVAASCVAV